LGSARLICGGGWNSVASSCMVTARSSITPGNRYTAFPQYTRGIGFRSVLPPGQP
jgi:hypothetical protein